MKPGIVVYTTITLSGIPRLRHWSCTRSKSKDDYTYKADDRIVKFLSDNASWANKPIAEIKASHLIAWLDSRTKDVSNSRVNRYRSKTSAIFKWAIRRDFVVFNPVAATEKYDESGCEREVYLTPEECRALVANCTGLLRSVVICALSTGLRRGAILGLRWRNVNFAENCLDIDASKNPTKRRSRRIPLTDAFRGELERMKPAALNEAQGDLVFPINPDTLRSQFERARDTCPGIPADKQCKLVFHILRHTAASLMVQAGISLPEVGKILGHSTPAMTMRYAHFAPDWARTPIEKLGEQLGLGGDTAGAAVSPCP